MRAAKEISWIFCRLNVATRFQVTTMLRKYAMRISVNKRWKLKTVAVCLAVVCVVAARVAMPGQSPSKQPPDPALATLGGGLISSTAVGHDVGGMVAYAFARLYPETSRGVMLLEAPVPGLDSWEEVKARWHIRFHQTPDLPEQLLAGREAIYIRHFLDDRNIFSDADVERYAKSYAAPEHLRALLEMYRAIPANEKFNAAQQSTIGVPLVLAPGENSPFVRLMPRLAEDLRVHGCADVKLEIIKNSVHYVVNEQPETVAELIQRYARQDTH